MLEPVAAAIRLGVTTELLFHYASRDTFSTHGTFRLSCTTRAGKTCFLTSDIDEFDARLHEPRSTPGEARARVDGAVTAHLRVESGGGCARCGSGVAVENAHIVPYRETQSNHHRNLIRLCSSCHGAFDSGVVAALEVVALKEGLIKAVCDRLLVSSGVVVRDVPTRHTLHGRSVELADLVTALQTTRSVIVRGIGGIGKTQLVLHATSAAQTARPLVWISLEDCPTEAVLAAYVEAAAHRIAPGEPISGLASVRACVVLDGVERAGCGIDAVSRLIASLLVDGVDIQLVATSQVRLLEVAFDVDVKVGVLDADASAALLPEPASDAIGTANLLEFADGHPLTLRVIAALVRHFDGPTSVHSRLRASPERPLEMPTRPYQTAGSSLDVCLHVAIEALSECGRTLLWALAQLPAGLATGFLSLDALGFADPASTVAELRGWHLVEEREIWSRPHLSLLSPVRDFVRRAIEQHATPGLDDMRRRLALAFASHLEDVNAHLLHGGRIETGMTLLDRELPNVLAIMALAARHVGVDAGFRVITTSMASNLQTYLFSAGHFEVGAEVMRTAADLAIATGSNVEALEMLSQLVSLANRGDRPELAAAAMASARTLACGDDPSAQALLLGLEADFDRQAGEACPSERMERRLAAAAKAGMSYELLMRASNGVATHRAALALFQQACHLEDAGRPDAALPLLERALSYFREAEDPINTGSALQRRGNCQAYVGRLTDAMESYAESASLFHRLAAVEYRSNALGEAGLLLGDYPGVTVSGAISEEMVLGGVDDVVDRIVEVVPSLRVPGNDWPYVLTRKACGIMILASFGTSAVCLAHMGRRLRDEVANVLAEREPEEWKEVGGSSLVTGHFSALAWLCEHLASVDPPDRRPDLGEIEGLAIIVEDMFSGAMRDTMFAWLARYLADRRGLRGLRPDALRAGVDGLAYGEAFELQGFSFPSA